MSRADEISAALAGFFETRADLPVVSAYLYGSEVRQRAHRESDVDVAVLLPGDVGRDPEAAFRLRVTLSSELVAALHRNEVDVVVLNQAPPLLARTIVSEGRRVFCSDPGADRGFVRDAQLRAADVEPFVARGRRRVLEGLRR